MLPTKYLRSRTFGVVEKHILNIRQCGTNKIVTPWTMKSEILGSITEQSWQSATTEYLTKYALQF